MVRAVVIVTKKCTTDCKDISVILLAAFIINRINIEYQYLHLPK